LTRICKEDKDWLIKKGYLKNDKGRYAGLIVCNKEHPSRSKTYYVEDRVASRLRFKNDKNAGQKKYQGNNKQFKKTKRG